VYVAIGDSTHAGGVLALRDTDGDGKADVRQYFGAVDANAAVLAHDHLYVAYRDRIVRHAITPGTLVPTGAAETMVSGLPSAGDHFAKNIQFDGADAMYVNVGSPSNSCQVQNRVLHSPGVDPCPELATRAGIWRFSATRANQTQADGEHFATGYRNTEALRFDPQLNVLHGIPHGRDMLNSNFPERFTVQQGADLPSEEYVRIDQGSNNGWPYCYHDWQKHAKVLAPEYGGGGAFVAFHGGHDRTPLPNEGFNVTFVPRADGVPQGTGRVFADGFTGGGTPLPQNAAHRPMGLAQGPDGSLYVSDDDGGLIWRIIFR
jgi:glucose/arabinose dehydrogenase